MPSVIDKRAARSLAVWSLTVAFSLSAMLPIHADRQPSPSGPQDASASTTTNADGTKETLPATGLIDDTDKAWVWSGMVSYSDPLLHGGTGHAGGPGTYGTYTFHGTAVDIVGIVGPSIVIDGQTHPIGRASIVVDGKQVSLSTMTGDKTEYGQVMAHITGLASANHVVEIHADKDWIVVDYIQATLTPVGPAGYAGATLIPEGNYTLRPRISTGTMLGASNWIDGSACRLAAPSQEAPVVWHFLPVGPNSYVISLAAVPNAVLTVLNQPSQSCTKYPLVGVWKDQSGPKQRWKVGTTDSGYIYIDVSDEKDTSLNICNRATSVGSDMIAYPHNQGETPGFHDTNEQWYLTQVK